MQPNSTLKKLRADAGFMPISEAAKLVGRPTATVRYWCKRQLVTAFRDGGFWFVSQRSLLERSGNNEKGTTSCE